MKLAAFILSTITLTYFLIWKIGPFLGQLGGLGLLGLFFISMAENATVIFPAIFLSLSIPLAVSLASQNSLVIISLVFATGASLGEGVGYFLGRYGKKLINGDDNKLYMRCEGWVRRHGKWAIIFLSISPFPPFDLVGIAAGVLKYPAWKFIFFCFLGRVFKYAILVGGAGEIWKLLSKLFPAT